MNVFVFGQSGRMGQQVIEQISQLGHQFVGGYSRSQPAASLDQAPDLIVDFSLPEASDDLLHVAQKYKCAVVSGTTGLDKDQFSKLKDLGQAQPVFWAANMSFGVYLMCRLTETLAKYDRFYSLHVEETHHIHKKDKPSGTALIIEEAAKKHSSNLDPTQSIREGEVFGVHRFIASNENESLEIRHEAYNRDLFAKGALEIGMWLKDQSPGFYQMQDFFRDFDS